MESFIEYLKNKKGSSPKKEEIVIDPIEETIEESIIEESIVESIVEEDHKIEIVETLIESVKSYEKESLKKIIVEESVIEEKIEPFEGYTIYRDKSETFICDMEITGANPQNSKARIIIESADLTYMFEGTIDKKGQCKIPLKKMSFLDENESGTIKLEVIAEDMVFVPWSESFKAVSFRKVQVKNITESEDNTAKIGIKVTRIK
jgi:hypothetical protein